MTYPLRLVARDVRGCKECIAQDRGAIDGPGCVRIHWAYCPDLRLPQIVKTLLDCYLRDALFLALRVSIFPRILPDASKYLTKKSMSLAKMCCLSPSLLQPSNPL